MASSYCVLGGAGIRQIYGSIFCTCIIRPLSRAGSGKTQLIVGLQPDTETLIRAGKIVYVASDGAPAQLINGHTIARYFGLYGEVRMPRRIGISARQATTFGVLLGLANAQVIARGPA